jgi:dihydrofolate synthase/folylpolyglutamate synthase
MGRINYERTAVIPYLDRQLKLDRMRQLLTRLGQPDAGKKIIHVAGTKGKGSTSAMMAGMLTAAGFRTGLFSSPHMERIEERFVVDGQPCSADEFVALVHRMQPVVGAMDEEAEADGDPSGGPTYFDITTAMALVHFIERQTDAVVLEVGLGGRLDSTNVCFPVVCVITSISFDHTRQLGNTLALIAREKAGIIKPGVPVVCGVTAPEPQTVIAEVAREHGCRLIQAGRDYHYFYRPPYTNRQGSGEAGKPADKIECPLSGTMDFEYTVPGQEQKLENVPLAMLGRHQAANAAAALAVITELRHQGWCISADAMRLGLSRTILPGRVEYLAGEPPVVLDSAHNPASARALVETLAEFPAPARRTLIVSISRDKDVQAILRELVPHFDRILVTEYQDNRRAVPTERLGKMIRVAATPVLAESGGTRPEVSQFGSPAEAWRYACQTAISGELVCITGSFFLAAEMLPLVLARRHEGGVQAPH